MPRQHHHPHRSRPGPGFIELVAVFSHYRRVHHHRRTRVMTHASMADRLPTSNVDGSPLSQSEIKTIEWFDTASPDPTVPFATQDGPQTEFETGVLSPGEHGFSFKV